MGLKDRQNLYNYSTRLWNNSQTPGPENGPKIPAQRPCRAHSGRTATPDAHPAIEKGPSYNRENETYNFLKRNVQFSLFFTPSKQRHLITI